MSDPFNEVMELEIEATGSDTSQSNQISSNNFPGSSESVVNVSGNENCVKMTLTLLDGKFFKFVSSSNGKSILMACVKCEPDVVNIKGSPNSSSNFLSHLKRKHGQEAVEEYHDYAKQVRLKRHRTEAGSEHSTTSKSIMISQQNFEQDLVQFFINSMIPLNVVEDPFFIAMLNNLGLQSHALNVISRRSLSRRIEAEYAQQMSEIKLTLESVQYICTVVDIWSSRKRSFLGVTAHWIDTDLDRQCKTLACRRFPGIHNYKRIAMILDEIQADFNVSPAKIVATVTDNGSNFIKAFTEFGVSTPNLELRNLEEDVSDEEDDEVIGSHDLPLACQFRCAAHTLNLCATTDANRILKTGNYTPLCAMHHNAIGKCNVLWNSAGRPKTAEIIQSVLGHTLSKPGVTRWNSLYDAMKQIYSVKDKNIHLHRALCLTNYISDGEYEYINEYITCSSQIAEALDILQGDAATCYGLLIPCLMDLRKKLQKLESTPLKYCHELAVVYRQSVE
ncbi:PREDICTED: uncharacterized protein LOC108358634 [Rhagoletis zephyria]|uniref:uncharacterized protein LOC108358634 n=1 Tax=Rhagoletis zephyria TaxID=28612 RepID=UPI0008114836|nr:PREDICTED: uncharacterized protein LOC108358634 [Rhagoletis zephyria]